jgi:NAD(P)H dehydrogenase (quinone)
MKSPTVEVLVLYYSRQGSTAQLARQVCRGVESVAGASSRLRTVAALSAQSERPVTAVPETGAPWVSLADLREADGLLLGSPVRFGNMAAPLKHFLEQTGALWVDGSLVNKPAAVFTSSQSMHGGQESTLLSMLNPLLHLGMICVGLPYTEPALSTTRSGGTPYGASHVVHTAQAGQLTDDEQVLARALGRRVALLAQAIKAARPIPAE